MARRRLNTRFLWISLSVVGVVGVGGAVTFKYVTRARPQQFVNQAKIAEQQQQWDVAAANLGRAASMMPRDSTLRVELGQALDNLSAKDPSAHAAAVAAWTQATEIDPSNVVARQLLLNAAEKDLVSAESQPKTDRTMSTLTTLFQNVSDQADQLAKLDPTDTRMKWVVPSLNIRRWLLTIPIPLSDAESSLSPDQRPTDQQKVDAAVAQLTQAVQDDPTSPAGYWIARAKVKEAQLALADGRPATAGNLLQSAAGVYDAGIAAHPANLSAVYANKVQVLTVLLESDPRPEQRKQYQAGLEDALDHAQAAADPKNLAAYTTLKLRWAEVLWERDPAGAEKVLHEVIAKNPPIEMLPRLELAQMLGRVPARRNDALAVLDELPTAAPVDLPPSRQNFFTQELTDEKFLRAKILFSQLTDPASPGPKAPIAAKVQAILDDLGQNETYASNWQFLKLKGQFQFAQGHSRDAVQSFTAAVDRMHEQTTGSDLDLLVQLAQVYAVTGQNAAAVALLEPLVAEPATAAYLTPHLLLAELYLDQHDTSHLQPQLDWLTAHAPDSPDVIQLRIRALDPATDKDAIAALYARLPEQTPTQINLKARLAVHDGNPADAVRLLKGVYDRNPADPAAARALVQAYSQNNQKPQAQAVLADAIRRNPNDSTLVVMSQVLGGTTAKALSVTEAKEAQQNDTDPFTREMALAEASRTGGDTLGELQHLKAAYAIKPDNRDVLNRLFSRYLGDRNFDSAHALLDDIARSDADDARGEMAAFHFDMAKGDNTASLADAQKLVADFPEFSTSWDALGNAVQSAGRLADAVTDYQQALSKQANDQTALRGLIGCSYQLGKQDDAKHFITLARSQYPDSSVYREMEVRHEIQFGSPDSLVPSLTQAIADHPEIPDNYRWASQCLLRSSDLDQQHGQPDDAAGQLQKARDLLQQASGRWPDDLQFAGALAAADLKAGDLPAGVTVLQAIATRPAWKDRPDPQLALAELYQQAGQPQTAVPVLRTALIQSDYAIPVEVKLASLLTAQGQADQSLVVLGAHRDNPSVLAARADALMALGRGADAEAELTAARVATDADAKTSHTDPARVDTVLQDMLASVEYRRGEYDAARTLSAAAVAANPNDFNAQYLQGMIALQPPAPDPAAAIAHLSIVRDSRPADVQARLGLAQADMMRGDRDGATRELEAALLAAPGEKNVRLKLVELYSAATPPQLLQAEQVLEQGLSLPLYKNDTDFLRQKALVLARSGQTDEAVNTIRAAMAQVPDKSVLVRDYLNVLLLAKNSTLLLQESDALVADPSQAPWWAYDLRARAKSQTGDRDGATADFDSALTAAAAQDRQPSSQPAGAPAGGAGGAGGAGAGVSQQATSVANDAATDLGVDSALALILPRAQNDTSWKLIALSLEEKKGDHAAAVRMAESAMASMGTLPPFQQEQLLDIAGSLYLTTDPPQGDQAADVYQQLLKRRPGDMTAMNNLACILVDDVSPPRPQEALKYSQQAFDRVQQTGQVVPTVYDTQGWVLIRAGRVDDGIAMLQKIGSDAQLPEVHYHLAEGMLQKASPEGARRELQLAGDMIDAALAAARPVDPALRPKIDAALKDAQKMIDAKAQAGP